jgi:hypothetical protein
MRKILLSATLLLAAATLLSAAEIRGTYIEARNADIYVAQCFANSEAGLVGDLAVMAWKVDQGSWNNVDLSGLGVAAVVKAATTLGDPFHSPYPAKSILIVDSRANVEQREALQSFAHKMAGDLVQTVTRVEAAPIEINFNGNMHAGTAVMTAGNLARIQTRALRDGDAVCHNAFTYYQPLTKLDHSMPAHTVDNRFEGEGLNVTWSSPDKNSAFLGSFAVGSD